jgi:hypothetical protein
MRTPFGNLEDLKEESLAVAQSPCVIDQLIKAYGARQRVR